MTPTGLFRLFRIITPEPLYRALRPTLIDLYYRARRAVGADGVVELNGIRLELNAPQLSPYMRHQMRSGAYERPESALIRRFLARDDVVMELGAGSGYVGLLCAACVGETNVHSFEANPTLEPLIRRNYALNGRNPKLTIALLGRGYGVEAFFVARDFWSSSQSAARGGAEVRVERRDLNDSVRAIRPTFLIMDIEGGELDVAEYLEPGTIRKIAMELHPEVAPPGGLDAMFATLERKGFAVAFLSPDRRHVCFTRSGA